MTDLRSQPIPDETCCPTCGADPTPESLAEQRLGDLGYLHDDRTLECPDGHTWMIGMPVGTYDGADDLECPCCDDTMVVHRVEMPHRSAKVFAEHRGTPHLVLHLKCPTCYYFRNATRYADDGGVALIGDPRTTGSIDGAEPMGYPDDHDGPGKPTDD